MPTRRDNFYAYYKANPDKLKGKSVDEAYAAMKRNVQNTGNRAGKTDAGKLSSAVERRLAQATESSRRNAVPKSKEDVGFKTLRNNQGPRKNLVQQLAGRKNEEGKTLGDQFREDIGVGKKKKKPQFNAAIERKLIKYSQSRKA